MAEAGHVGEKNDSFFLPSGRRKSPCPKKRLTSLISQKSFLLKQPVQKQKGMIHCGLWLDIQPSPDNTLRALFEDFPNVLLLLASLQFV